MSRRFQQGKAMISFYYFFDFIYYLKYKLKFILRYFILISVTLIAFFLIFMSNMCEAKIVESPNHLYENLSSDKIIEDLKNGKDINYREKNVYENIDLAKEGITNIQSSIKFTNSRFIDDVNFKGSVFNKSVIFENTIFEKEVIFEDAIFEKDAIFNDSRFESDVHFDGCEFNRASDFENAVFNNDTFFSEAIFNDVSKFQQSNFSKGANFVGTNFLQLADFKYSQFKFANFNSAEFFEDTGFRSATFREEANFELATFNKRSNFLNSYFINDLRLDRSRIKDTIYFDKDTKFQKDLSLKDATINILYIDGSEFNETSRISLTNSNFDSLKVDWFMIRKHLDYNPSVYQAIVKNFHEARRFDYEDDCYYLLRKNELCKQPNLKDLFFFITCGFGVKLHFTIIVSLFIISLFSLIFWEKNSLMRSSDIVTHNQRSLSLTDTFYFSLMNFVSSSSEFKPKGRSRWLLALEKILGWIMMAILFFTLARMGIR